MSAEINHLASRLAAVRRVLFITGAGISADSGLPTYRGVGGLYDDDTETEDGLSIEEALSGECLIARPEITWKYLAQIQRNCRQVEPNAAHYSIARLENDLDVTVLTQNIDGLHLRAGSTRVIEIHGSLASRHCMQCGGCADVDSPLLPPKCERCGGIVRPDVVLFGEALPQVALHRLDQEYAKGFDAVIVVGTTAMFPYIAEPVLHAIRRKTPTIEINPAQTSLSGMVDFHLPMRASVVVPMLSELLSAGCR